MWGPEPSRDIIRCPTATNESGLTDEKGQPCGSTGALPAAGIPASAF